MAKNYIVYILFLVLVFVFPISLIAADSVKDQLKENGYSSVQDYFETRRTKKTTGIIPESGEEKKTLKEANKIYSDLYDITPAEEKKIPDKIDIYYFPGILSPSFYGLTGLSETITANTLGKGKYRVGAKFQYKSIKKSFGDNIPFKTGEKAEIVSFPISATMGIVDNFEVGFNIPINSWDFNTPYLKPSNEKETSVGDATLLGKFRIPLNKESTTGMALVAGFRMPSGNNKKLDANDSSGQTDFTMLAVMSAKAGLANLHLNLGYTFTGNPGYDDTNYFNDDKAIFRFGADFSKNEDTTVSFELAGEDWGKNGNKLEAIPGVKAMLRPDVSLEMYIPICIHNDEYYGYKFRVSSGITYSF